MDPQGKGKSDIGYSISAVLGGSASAHPFRQSLSGIAVGVRDRIYTLGDDEVRVFEPGGALVEGWGVVKQASCIAVGPGGRVYLGSQGRVEIYTAGGRREGGFSVGGTDRPAVITAIKLFRQDIYVADAAARILRRCDAGGRPLGVIGDRSKAGSFILPNRWLDFDIDSKGVIRATDTGRHQVTAWSIDGSPLGAFGKFGMRDPADFVGCCNPVNVAVTPDGKIVTGEKMVSRVKLYEPDGRLLAVIGPEHFDPGCIHIHLAVDSRSRILAADPERRDVKIFSPEARTGMHDDVRPGPKPAESEHV